MPTSALWFISGIFDALTKFRSTAKGGGGSGRGGGLSDALVQDVSQRVVDDITAKFRELVKETIISARKTEESLEKLRRKREGKLTTTATSSAPDLSAESTKLPGSGGRPSGDLATDRDKMVVQLYLDAHEYGSLLRPFGVHKERYAPLQSVLKLCRRADWILAADDSPEPMEVEEDE